MMSAGVANAKSAVSAGVAILPQNEVAVSADTSSVMPNRTTVPFMHHAILLCDNTPSVLLDHSRSIRMLPRPFMSSS